MTYETLISSNFCLLKSASISEIIHLGITHELLSHSENANSALLQVFVGNEVELGCITQEMKARIETPGPNDAAERRQRPAFRSVKRNRFRFALSHFIS